MKKIMLLLIILLGLSATFSFAQENYVQEEDNVLKKEITIPSFEIVVNEGGGNIYFHYSHTSSIILEGTNTCMKNVSIETLSSTLKISPKGGLSKSCNLDIHIYTPVLKEIQQNGGGTIVVNKGFDTIDVFKCSLDGGGDINISAIKVNSLFATIDGGGEISAQVKSNLNGRIRGGGLIYYQGNPIVEENVSGGGAIRQK